MRRFLVLMFRGADHVPTRKQIDTLRKLGLIKKAPYFLTTRRASALIGEELEMREIREVRRIMKEKQQAREQQQRMALMREAQAEVMRSGQSGASLADTEDLNDIRRNQQATRTKRGR